VAAGTSTAGTNGLGTRYPSRRNSQGGYIRIAPSTQPMYQSGWAGELTWEGSNGPYSQIGLIWTSPPRSSSTARMAQHSTTDRVA
jgi:hypothetical protein